MKNNLIISAAHCSPIFLDADKTTNKVIEIIEKASNQKSKLIVFPESFIPGFPVWNAIDKPINNHDFFKTFVQHSIRIDGPQIKKICEAAKKFSIIVSIGFSESVPQSVGCLFNSNIIINELGELINHHRKIVPTFFEKLTWSNGDSHGLKVVNTSIGKLGALICGENTNPLARYSMIAEGEQIHISAYPPIWPTHSPNANDKYDLASAIKIRAGAHSFEGKVFNIVASSILDLNAKKILADKIEGAEHILSNSPKGISMIVGPDGMPIIETSSDKDVILSQEIDLDKCIIAKQFHDLSGYYNRFDIFEFKVNRFRTNPIEIKHK
jgi:nitrilase